MSTQPISSLSWKHFCAGESGFFRAPVLLSAKNEAILIDGGFTLPDGHHIVREIKNSGKRLTTIYISQSDPDYYFSLAPVFAAFPHVQVLAASEAVEAIKASVEKKIAVWGPQLKENGPQSLEDIIFPESFDEPALFLEGHEIQIVTVAGLKNRRFLWIPSLKAVFGGVLVFSGLHVWTADTATKHAHQAWIHALEDIEARNPEVIVPGHLVPDSPTDISTVRYTRDYLIAFEDELKKAADSSALKEAMITRYPDAGLQVALSIGAQVATGEIQWGE